MVKDYDRYEYVRSEFIRYALTGAVSGGFVGFIFYKSIPMILVLAIIGMGYPFIKRDSLLRERKEKVSLAFREFLYAIIASFSSGYELKEGLIQSVEDLSTIYPEGCELLDELHLILRKYEFGVPIEVGFQDFSDRVKLEEVRNFTEVLSINRRIGGNIVKSLNNTAGLMIDRLNAKEEMAIMVTQKEAEIRVLKYFPFAFILLIDRSGGGFMDPMYSTVMGRVMMTVALIIIVLAIYVARKMLDVDIL